MRISRRVLQGAGIAALILSLIPAFAFTAPPRSAGDDNQASGAPDLARFEKDLLAVLNRERAAHGLGLLRLSPALVTLARKHCAEMSRLNVLTHESATGKSFTDRLFDAGVTFTANGENVARSGTAEAEIVHQSFMASPGHRANVLNPDFDEIGIGILPGGGNVFFVTEDFIGALARRSDREVRAFILGVLNEARAGKRLAPVVLFEEADRMAAALAQDKAAGRKPAPVPAYFGESMVRLIVGPDLAMIAGALKGKDLARYGRAGIAVVFKRTSEYPGGAYFVSVLLIADERTAAPDELDRLSAVLAAANEVRARKKLAPLELDPDLAQRADDVIARRKNGVAIETAAEAGGEVFFAMFQKPGQIGSSLRKRLEDPRWRRIGISTVPIQDQSGDLLQYAVAVILAR